jgi:sec-independent protein translocase protein TatB
VFGVSFPEFVVLGTVALLVLGPEKLPGMLRTMGQWIAKIRRLSTEVRYQSGIDEVLRAEGFDGGLNELRSMMRGGGHAPYQAPQRPAQPEPFVPDRSREYPVEGPDAHGALPEDLVSPPAADVPALAGGPAVTEAAPELAAGSANPPEAAPVAAAMPVRPSPDAPEPGQAEAAGTSRPSNDSPRPAEPNG